MITQIIVIIQAGFAAQSDKYLIAVDWPQTPLWILGPLIFFGFAGYFIADNLSEAAESQLVKSLRLAVPIALLIVFLSLFFAGVNLSTDFLKGFFERPFGAPIVIIYGTFIATIVTGICISAILRRFGIRLSNLIKVGSEKNQ